jgi:hypothetical protein
LLHSILLAPCDPSKLFPPSHVGKAASARLVGTVAFAIHEPSASVLLTPPAEAAVIPLLASAHLFRQPLDKRHRYWHSVRYDHSGYFRWTVWRGPSRLARGRWNRSFTSDPP